jgi:hypothetical protein
MKKQLLTLITLVVTIFACNNDDTDTSQQESSISFNLLHSWDDTPVTNKDFNTLKFTNANGETMSITKLRYLISDVTFTKATGETIVLEGHQLIDVTKNTNLNTPSLGKIPNGTYSDVSFTFGFDNDANYNTNHLDLNTAVWNVPEMLGGGYHYMQLEGKFIDTTNTEKGYAYHAIRAVDNSGETQKFEDTFFTVNLGSATISKDTAFSINMNIAAWFKTPNTWDLNELNTMLMPNFEAQLLMFQNGQDVFRLTAID